MIKKLINNDSINIILLPIIFLFFFSLFFKNYLYHDTLLSFELFKYVYDFYITFNEIPVWIDAAYGGTRITYALIFFPLELASLFAIIGKILNFEAYYIFLIYLSLLYSVFFFGFNKLISFLFPKNRTIFLLFIIFISCLGTNAFNEYIFSILCYIFFPFYIYYLLKFHKNNKIQELFKILYLALLNFYLTFHYTFFIQIYLLIFLFVYLCFSKEVFFKLINNFKNIKTYLKLIPAFILFSLCVLNNEIFNSYEFLQNYRSSGGILNFENFIEDGDSKYYKIHSFFGSYLWGESNLIISSIGLYFLIHALLQIELYKTKLFQVCILLSLGFIILCFLPNYPYFLKYYIGKILYNLPLMKYHYHIFYFHLYAKTFVIILVLYGFNDWINSLSDRYYNHIKTLVIFTIINVIYFIIVPKPAFNSTEIIISYTLSITGFIIFYHLSKYFIKKDIDDFRKKCIFLILLSIIPVSIYNFSNHSFSNKISFYKKNIAEYEINRKIVKKNYESKYFKNKYKSKFNFKCLSNEQIYNEIPSTLIKNFIPRGSTDYAENIYNQNIYACKGIFAMAIVENIKNFSHMPKNFISNIADKINFINNQNYIFTIKNYQETITTNISYSDSWDVRDVNKKKLKIFNNNNFLGIYTEGSKFFELKYINKKEKLIVIFKLLIGMLTTLYFMYCLLIKKY